MNAFIVYEKIQIGLLFQQRVETDYPFTLVGDQNVTAVNEDFLGRIRLETDTHVFMQEGFYEISH